MDEAFQTQLDDDFPRIANLNLADVPPADPNREGDLPKTYSYTADYLAYRTCPRRYMIYRRYNFAPARARTMMSYGTLVHRTVEDLHRWLNEQIQAGRRLS
jgi:DNA helicase-2/ATP-dependent DNA helicase PcrA